MIMTKKHQENGNGMIIPDHAIERIARRMLPMIQNYYESEEGQQELKEWKEQNSSEQISKTE